MSVQVEHTYYFKEKYLSLHRFISYFHQLDAIRKAEPKKILFIGVGDGMVPGFLKKHPSFKVTTLDIDPALSPDVVGDVRNLPFTDGQFDLVCAFEVLEHLPFEDSKKAIAEIARVSAGAVLISVPHRRTGFELVLRFPFMRSLVGNSYLRLAALFPVKFPGHAISTQHYWEIDGRTTKLETVRNVFREHFSIEHERTPVLDSYLRFFTLRKKDALKHSYVREYYDENLKTLDEEYEDSRWHTSKERQFDYNQTKHALLAALGSGPYAYAVEVGPGDGVWTRFVKAAAPRIRLIEQSPEMLARAKRRLADLSDITYDETDILLAKAGKPADLLVAMRCFEYFSDKPAALKKFRELLAPNGRLIIVTKNAGYVRAGAGVSRTLHSGQVSKFEMAKLLSENGFALEAAYPATFRWKSSWFPMRLIFDALHRLMLALRSDAAVPLLSELAAESYLYVAHPRS